MYFRARIKKQKMPLWPLRAFLGHPIRLSYSKKKQQTTTGKHSFRDFGDRGVAFYPKKIKPTDFAGGRGDATFTKTGNFGK